MTATRRDRAKGEGLSGFRTIDLSLLSLDNDGQIHARMDWTIELERSSSGERTNGGLRVPVDLHIPDLWRIRLTSRLSSAILPGPIRNDMGRERIVVDQLVNDPKGEQLLPSNMSTCPQS